jgi:hypothetical protein
MRVTSTLDTSAEDIQKGTRVISDWVFLFFLFFFFFAYDITTSTIFWRLPDVMLVGAMKTYTGRRRAPGGVFINTGGNRRCEGVFVLAALLPPPVAAAALVCTSFAPAQLSLSLSLSRTDG